MATLPTSANPPPGSASGYSTSVNTNLGLIRQNDQTLEDRIEGNNNTLFSTGVIAGSYTPPLLAIGTGLAVNIAAHTSFIGFSTVHGSNVLAVPDNTSTVYLWEKQDSSFTATTSSTNPGTLTNPAIALGTCHTAAGVVSSLVETFNLVYPPGSNNPPVTEIYGPTYSSPYQKLWDADTTARTGGTISATVVVQQDVDTTKPITILRGTGEDVTLARTRAWTFSAPRTFSIVDGKRPVDNTADIREDLSITYTPL